MLKRGLSRYIEFLELLMEDEHNNRRDNSYKKRYAKAKLPSGKRVEDFDFTFQPSIDKKVINDCLTGKLCQRKAEYSLCRQSRNREDASGYRHRDQCPDERA